MRNSNNKLWISVGAIGFLLLAGYAGNSDYADELLAEQAYCANVTLYHATAGKQGWPDYRDMYNIMCVKYRGDPELFSNG